MTGLQLQGQVEIPEWEQELIDLFVGIFDGLGLPKSTAMIYGTLYCAEEGDAERGLPLLNKLFSTGKN